MASAPLGPLRPAVAPLVRGSASPGGRPVPLSLAGFECSLETDTLDALERVAGAITRSELAARFSRSSATEEVALLSTCHRVELLVLASRREEIEWWRASLPCEGLHWRLREGREVVRHIFDVAAGRESLAPGEAEVRGQVRAAARRVLSRHPRPILRGLLLESAGTADELSPAAGVAGSVASVAAAHLLSLLPRPRPRVLIVGAGVVGRQVARCLAPHARVTMVYHRRPPPVSFLRGLDVEAVGPSGLRELAATSDAIVTAAKFGDRGVRPSHLPEHRPVVLVDLGMPRNIDPAVRALPGVQLVDLQALHELGRPEALAPATDPRLDERAGRCADRVQAQLWEPWVGALYRSAEATRQAELATARSYLGPLTPAQEVAVERLTRRLVARLLLPATSRIRDLPTGPGGDRQRRLAFDLLAPHDPES